jgi:hypothetical protein
MIGEKFCWQHVQGLDKKINSLIRSQSTAFALAVIGLVAAGAALLRENFLLGVLLLYGGLCLLAISVLYGSPVSKWRPWTKRAFVIIYLGAVVAGSRAWIFLPAPLEVFASSRLTNYGPGSVISGIPWDPRYSELSFYIKNDSEFDYDNFDAQVSTDLVISTMRQTNGLAECKIEGIHHMEAIHWQAMHGGVPVGPADNPANAYVAVPVDKEGKPLVPVSGGADWTYRIRCDRFPAHSQIDFLAPLEIVNSPPSLLLYGLPTVAAWVNLRARFQTSGRNRVESISKCPMNQKCNST